MPGRYAPKGLFIALEGGEGCGKSTQSRMLATTLSARGHTVELTREPGGTSVGAALRSIVLDPATGELSPRTEALLYAADKAEHVDRLVLPALDAGHTVITDRYVDSTLAYQGAGRALDIDQFEPIARWATADLRPHLTFVLDIDPAVGLRRAQNHTGQHDRIEAEPLEFHRRVRESFLALAAADAHHYAVIDADQEPSAVETSVLAALDSWLSNRS